MFPQILRRQAAPYWVIFALALGWAGMSMTASAHEIRPAVIDLSFTEDGQARFDIQLNLEAMIAQIGPEHSDTTESPEAGEYEALRRLPPAGLQQAFEQFQPRFLEGVEIRDQDGAGLDARIGDVNIDKVGDTGLARLSTVTLLASPRPQTRSIVWSWSPRFGANILRVVEPGKEDGYSVYLTEGAATEPVPWRGSIEQSAGAVFLNYTVIGFTHIVPKGLDHILFVVGLFLLSTRMRPLLIQVTSFTLAHSVTLALGVLGVVTLSPAVVEPLIAASIVYVAIENILSSKLQHWRPAVVFGFGLLHGLGFAGVLSDIGISQDYFVTALVAFNVGVELGQIAVILGCFALVGLWFRNRPWYRAVITIPASLVVALVGAYWLVERTLLA